MLDRFLNLGASLLFLRMFIRRKQNKSGSYSIQIIDKSSSVYKIVKVMGSSKDEKVLNELTSLAKEEINKITGQQNLEFSYSEDEKFLLNLREGIKKVYVKGPDLLLGKLFNEIGYDLIPNPLFKELVITRLIHPGSKLKT